jgi:dipeptidyl aminopeptidase/acylaminoacyl peptidase
MTKKTAPYGSWPSPITADLIVAGTVSVSQVALDGDHVYWVEGRPAEKGRNVVVRRGPDGAVEDVTPGGHNARTRVHEYGGASYVVADGTVYYSNFADQRLYSQRPGEDPKPLTPEGIDLRYADACVDVQGRRLITVREDHSDLARTGEAVNEIVCVSIDPEMGAPEEVLVTGADFYSNPRLSPDGSRMSWLQWNHPNMPWDGCELWVAQVGDAGLTRATKVAGGARESIFQPEWSPEGVLHFLSDASGWWNLYRLPRSGEGSGEPEPLCEKEAEFATPAWVFGMRTYGFASGDSIVCTYAERGSWTLATLDTASGQLTPFGLPYTDYSSIKVDGNVAVFRAGSPTRGAEIVQLDLSSGETTVVSRPSSLELDEANLSVPEAVEFPTEDGHTSHAFYYAPTNAKFNGTGDEKPPLLVKIHGGPTGATSSTLSLSIQYWTSRGFAVADVNYGGSTGYGTAYRRRLNDNWGIVDVDDCVNVARFLADRGDVDGDRLAIDGGSSGGFTTLAVLTFRDTFHVGTSYYGVTDLEALARDTHKFESRYLDGLIAPYPEQAEVWRERSPIYNVDKLDRPVILFQGMEDKIVPPNQAETMVAAVREKGLPVAYVAYEGEQHGFRQAANIKRTLEGELYFYSRILGFELAEDIEPVPIDNL